MISETLSNKIEAAKARLVMAHEMSVKYFGEVPYVCISGGKDSSVIAQLAIETGLPYIFHHSHTTVDAPMTVYFVRSEMERFEKLGHRTQIRYPKLSMWKLIESYNGMPPTRLARYCCKYFKEAPVREDEKAFIITGVRWAESSRRKSREEFEVNASRQKNALRLKTEDQDLERRMFEECKLKGEKICNPIIDWTDEEVWEYLQDRKVPINVLYKMGWKRIGCIGCPMASKTEREKQFAIFPKYKKAYIDAIERGIKLGRSKGKVYTWAGGQREVRVLAKVAFAWYMEGGRDKSLQWNSPDILELL